MNFPIRITDNSFFHRMLSNIIQNTDHKTKSNLITHHSLFIRKFVTKIKEKYVRREKETTGRIKRTTRRFTRLSLTLKRKKNESKN